MKVAAQSVGIGFRRVEPAQVDTTICRRVIKIEILKTFVSLRVGVIQDPIIVRQVGAMTIERHPPLAHHLIGSFCTVRGVGQIKWEVWPE